MARRKIKRYYMDMCSEGTERITALMGAALFIRIVYFFGFTRLESAGFMHLTFGLILPLLLEAAFIVLVRGMRFQNSGLYILLGTALCLVMFWQCFRYNSILRLILGFTAYLCCGTGLLAVLIGMINPKIMKWSFIMVAVARLVFFNVFQNLLGLHWIALLFEIAGILDMLALSKLSGELKSKK